MSNIFRRVPGVAANNIDQGDTGNGFRMRGFGTEGTHGADTAMYGDGVPHNIPSSQGDAATPSSAAVMLESDGVRRASLQIPAC
ncbi:MAG: TonB-dependent receptor plug domain-containing protein [Pseudomonadota bacterium]|nr:TonB-dependent receptor plug domain-containing protein [Pseudomonadota bacterium]